MNRKEIIETGLPPAQETLSGLWDEQVGDEFAIKDAKAPDPNHILQTGFAFGRRRRCSVQWEWKFSQNWPDFRRLSRRCRDGLVFIRDRRAISLTLLLPLDF